MEKTHEKRIYKLILSLCMILLTINLSACGDDAELVLITTESGVSQDSVVETGTNLDTAVEEVVVTEEAVTEEATDEEKSVTLEDVFYANRGDVLLSGGTGCSINTVYYSDGTEIYSEYSYLGFDEEGNYIQAYEDSDGDMEVLDITNQYWYVVEDGQTYIKIYPEESMSGVIIDINHNQLIMPEPQSDSGEVITDIYRMGGMLNIETEYTNNVDEVFSYRYVVDDALMIQEIYCYDQFGTQMSYAWITKDAVYNMPESLINLKSATDKRIIRFSYPDGSGYDTMYEVPVGITINLELLSSSAYIDASCSTPWIGAGNVSEDETIYIKYNQ
ncbi:MAG: hypothetical protein E7259_06625 [Lachnospiraceae bacterium]|nr:hypothetical protein [Lachnospiraceae bacterium]